MGDTETSPDSTQSLVAFAGWLVAAISFAVGCVLLTAEALFHRGNPYSSLVTYLVIPSGMIGGLALVVVGTVLEWRRKRRHLAARALPVVDLNSRRTRRTLLVVCAGGVLFLAVSAVATYRAFLYTESNEFCGTVCHQVMTPEYQALQTSSHARVHCVDCHIGPGVDWYVRSKLSGMGQAWAVLFGTYELPIETPLEHLRPARDTCEHCHWPARFSGSIERVQWHFWYDEASTPSRYHLLMKVGGVSPATGRPEGIHWHSDSSSAVRYWPRDRARRDIPWVEVERPDGSRTVYRTPDAGALPPADEVRRMDCIDCHNRPTHVFRPPAELVNAAMAEGVLDRRLPYLKRNAVEILSIPFQTTAESRERIAAEVADRYPVGSAGGLVTAGMQASLADTLSRLYEAGHFPEHGASWRSYPDHLGHRVFPGCFRCHDGEHRAEGGEVIRAGCDLCHTFVHQAWGAQAEGPVTYRTQPFEHPGGQGDLHDGELCMDCHDADTEYPGRPRERRALP